MDKNSEILASCKLVEDNDTVVLYKFYIGGGVRYDVCSNCAAYHFTDLFNAIEKFKEVIHNGLI